MRHVLMASAPGHKGSGGAAPLAGEFKRSKKLTLPVVKFEMDKAKYLLITAAMHVGKRLKGSGAKSQMEPATLCNVVDLQTGEEMQLICATLVKSILTENYDNHSYVGHAFEVTKHNKREGKGYYDYSIDEVELPADKAEIAKQAQAALAANPAPALPDDAPKTQDT